MLIYHRGLCHADSPPSAPPCRCPLVWIPHIYLGLITDIWLCLLDPLSQFLSSFMRWANSFISSALSSVADYDVTNPLVFFPSKISVCFLSSWIWTGLWLLRSIKYWENDAVLMPDLVMRTAGSTSVSICPQLPYLTNLLQKMHGECETILSGKEPSLVQPSLIRYSACLGLPRLQQTQLHREELPSLILPEFLTPKLCYIIKWFMF